MIYVLMKEYRRISLARSKRNKCMYKAGVGISTLRIGSKISVADNNTSVSVICN